MILHIIRITGKGRRTMKENNFEKVLPDGYKSALQVDAKDKRTGIILNLAALVIMAAVAALLIMIPFLGGKGELMFDGGAFTFLLYIPIFAAYIILHELTHGAAYKLSTGQKLTFGITLTVAFCGVPDIYVYRRPSIFSAAAPLVLFSLIFGGLAAAFYFISLPIYFVFSLVFATHLGGCVGDMYLVGLLLFKYRNNSTLIRDTGPKQNIYIKEEI